MKILAIDPASIKTGWAVLEDHKLVAFDLFHVPGSTPIEKRLLRFQQELERLISEYRPDAIVIEDQYLRFNVDTLKTLSWVRGVVMLAAAAHDIPLSCLQTTKARKAIGLAGRSSKDAVRAAIRLIYSLPEDLDNNISDAIAIGLAYISTASK